MTPEERKRRATLAIRTRWHGDDDAIVREIRRGMSLELVRDLIDQHGFTVEDLVQFRADEAPEFTEAQKAVLRPILSRGGE
jgi:hypothetical protein